VPISQDDAHRVAAKLSAVPGFPKTAEQLEVVIEILAERLSDDPLHHSALTTKVLEDCDFFPGPKSLISMIHATMPEGAKRPFGCSKCDYTGFIETTMTRFGRTASASAPCSCRLHPAPDPEEWEPRPNPEGTTGPVAAQVRITRDWADGLTKQLSGGVKSL
jgi:hypothetical protein